MKATKQNWTLDGYKQHYGTNRVFRTRAEIRCFAKRHGFPLGAIVRTLNPVDSGIDDLTGHLYRVAPDGSYYE